MQTKPILLPDPIPAQDINFQVDGGLLRDILRRKALTLALVGLTVGGGYALRALYSAPQQYLGECSIALQQSGPAGLPTGLSALLGGGGGGSHKYMGLLASRMMAEKVEQRVHLQQRLHLGSPQEAVGLLRGGLKPDDTTFDGLLIIHFVMDAPPIKAHDAQKAEQVRLVVADVANEYANQLSDFYSESNSEGSNALLKIAENERQEARANYQRATNRLRDFVASWKKMPVANTPVGGNMESNSPADLLSLYSQIDALDAEMRSARVAQDTSTKLRTEQIKNLSILPAEDSLLNNARSRVTEAELNFKRVSDVYGPSKREYSEAEDSLRHAKDELAQQLKGIQKLQTSDQVELRKQLAVQKDRRDSLAKRIASAENSLFSRRDLAWRLEQLRTDQGIAQGRMQQAEVKAVDVRLSTLTGKSKISILDKALPPDTNMAGNASPTRASILIGLLAMCAVTALEYMRAIRRRSLNAFQFALTNAGLMSNGLPHPINVATANGNGAHVIHNTHSIDEDSLSSEPQNGNGSNGSHTNGSNSNGNKANTGNASGGSNGNGGNGKNGGKTAYAKSARRR